MQVSDLRLWILAWHVRVVKLNPTCSLHCSSFSWGFNQEYLKDFIRYPQKGTTMETIGRTHLKWVVL